MSTFTETNNKGKHLLNTLENAVTENLLGYVLQHPHLQVIPALNTIVSRDAVNNPQQKCLILSGAGSGHEPMQHGFVGVGGLAASVAGEVFASPSTGQVIETIRLLAGPKKDKEVLAAVNNYTGDRLNFGLAVEQAKLEGISTELFCFGDDVAFMGHKEIGVKTGKRGLGGVALLNKCLGALASRGHSLADLMTAAKSMTSQIATMSVSLTSCDVPGSGRSFQLKDSEMELGLGIHGETGILRTSNLLTSRQVVKVIIDSLLDPLKSSVAEILSKGEKRVAVLLNNLGGLSNFELNIVTGDALSEMAERGLKVERILSGSFCTSFSMNGVSISIMKVDDEILKLLDEPTSCPVFATSERKPFQTINSDPVLKWAHTETNQDAKHWVEIPGCSPTLYKTLLLKATQALVSIEGRLNELDRIGGDGDCGLTYKKGSLAILARLEKETPSFLDLAAICREMGGTSGAIYSLFFTSLHASVLENEKSPIGSKLSQRVKFWSDALERAMKLITKYSWAEPGDRTMLESIYATYKCLNGFVKCTDCGDDVQVIASKVSSSVVSAAEATAQMTAKAGRATYVNAGKIDHPDPGAVGVATWISTIANHISGQK